MNRRDFFKSAAAFAAVAGFCGKRARAEFPGFGPGAPAPMNNPIWLMTSAFPGQSFEQVVQRALSVGAQGLEPCVFRRVSVRKLDPATHLDYATFDLEAAKKVVAR